MKIISKFLFSLIVMLFLLGTPKVQSLDIGFHAKSCPKAKSVVRSMVASFCAHDPMVSAPLLRLHFHDCFVRGCDGSVLLNSTKANMAGKDAMPNQSLDGFYAIDAAKQALEIACPGVVSCADTVAVAASDAVTLAAGNVKRGNLWEVPTGRWDRRVSMVSEALAGLPDAYGDFVYLRETFAARGLGVKDLAILSGNSHCYSFHKRLFNFSGKGDTDPTLDPKYAAMQRSKCAPYDMTMTAEMAPGSATTFDTRYYHLVNKRRGLFHSDQALLQDQDARTVVYSQLHSSNKDFLS